MIGTPPPESSSWAMTEYFLISTDFTLVALDSALGTEGILLDRPYVRFLLDLNFSATMGVGGVSTTGPSSPSSAVPNHHFHLPVP